MNITGNLVWLGTGSICGRSYNYFLNPADRYVYQYHRLGFFQGWLCSLSAWENTFHKIITSK